MTADWVERVTGAARQAFLALALHDAGQPDEALRVALLALAPTLPLYSRSVAGYAAALEDRLPSQTDRLKKTAESS